MRRSPFLLVVPCLCVFHATEAFAQIETTVHPGAAGKYLMPAPKPGLANPAHHETVIDGTLFLLESEEGRAALEDFHRRKANGELPLRKAGATATVGDTVSFMIWNFQTNGYMTERFVWKAAGSISNIWVEVSEATGPGGNGHVTDADVQGLLDALEVLTPAGSYNPAAGILQNNITIFGDGEPSTSLPDVDGDSKIDVFLHDIVNDDHPEGFIAGYIDPRDLSTPGNGNKRDIFHLDTNEGLFLRPFEHFLCTAAVEVQRLIQFNYPNFGEEAFVGSGLAAFACTANGYPYPDTLRYFDNPAEHKLSLFSWTERIVDYERALLLTTYFAERTDILVAGSLTRESATGRFGYDNVAASVGLTFKEILVDLHTATLINGTGLSTENKFNLQTPPFVDARVLVDPDVIVDGRTISDTVRRDTVNGGAVLYRVWTDVEDFVLTAAPFVESGQTPDLTLARAALRAIVERPDGSVEISDLDLEPTDLLFPGLINRLTLIFVHTNPVSRQSIGASAFDRLIYDYSAEWETQPVAVEEEPELPKYVHLVQNFPNPFNTTTTISYALLQTEDVTLTVVDLLGRVVKEHEPGTLPAGKYEVSIDAINLPSGVYFYRLEAGDFVEAKRMVVVKQ